ncbi:MAG: tRNA (5-methylaminomethyl-2-thiouridine)(34)-methyltransferase MnmD [Bacteroidales bacterium]|nr:tRNA (5-methylaminomethyl-2-thiouridine)(34)-methyltransferase MnmD [Bacteroidales bacterium]
MKKINRLVLTADGSHTIYVPEIDEHYHSVHGAVQESQHIFINYGFKFCKADPLHIFEVGYGTGLNALLTAVESMNGTREVSYTAIEKHPVEEHIVHKLNYQQFAGEKGAGLFSFLNSSRWGTMQRICRNFSIKKIESDLVAGSPEGAYDLIYFDAFGPEKQSEMWTQEIFEKISGITVSGGILVTYSAKGQVKRNLKCAGFEVELLPGPPGKRHVIRAIKI